MDKLSSSPQSTVDTPSTVGQNQDSLTQFGAAMQTNGQATQPVDQVPAGRRKTGPTQTSDMKKNLTLTLIVALIAVVAGIGTGYGGYKLQAKAGKSTSQSSGDIQKVAGNVIQVGDVFGVNDSDTFSDSAQGYLEAGGLDGEGSHRLLRPGGESQTVYLTSSVTDLNPLVGMEVKVSGETFKGQKAGWLMDVGRVEVLKTIGDRPITE